MKIIQISDMQFIDEMNEEDIIICVNVIYKNLISVNAHNEKYGLIVCGDIIEGNDEKNGNKVEAYKNASVFFDELKKRFLGDDFSLFIVPGNHDIIDNSLESFDNFCRPIVSYRNDFENNNAIGIISENINYILSSTVIEKDYTKSKIDCDSIERACSDAHMNVIVGHHEMKYDKTLISNDEELFKIIGDKKINFFLHGHTHKGYKVYEWGGCTFIGSRRCFEADWGIDVRKPSFNVIITGKLGVKKVFDCRYEERCEMYKYYPIFPVIEYPDTKHKYLFEEEYIERNVTLISSNDSTEIVDGFLNKKDNLYNIIKYGENDVSGKKIILLSEAGVGKTKEIMHLAKQLYEDEESYPYLIYLNNYTGQKIEDLLPSDYSGLKQYLYLLFDGYDEIAKDSKTKFNRILRSFCEEHTLTKIVITSRENFVYNNLPHFTKYKLGKLDNEDIAKYLDLHDIDQKDFLKQIHQKKLSHILNIPFYLKYLSQIYKKENSLPNSSILMDELLEYTIKIDEAKFANEEEIIDERLRITNLLCKVAFSIQLLGQTYLSIREYEQLFSIADRDILKYRGVWSKKDNSLWTFEHNNFREYLAALHLNKIGVEKVKEYVLIGGKLINNWVGSVAYLVSIGNQKELLELLIDSVDLSLLKFEKDKIEKKYRIIIFKKIIEKSRDDNVWLDKNGSISEELANFAGSRETVEFLLNEIRQQKRFRALSNAINVLSKFNGISNLFGLEDEVRGVLLNLCANPDVRDNEISDAIYALAKLNLYNEEVTETLIGLFEENGAATQKTSTIRSAMYYYLDKSNNIDNCIDFIIYGIDCLHKDMNKTKEGAFTMESYHLMESLKGLSSFSANNRILEIIIEKYSKGYFFSGEDIIKIIVEKAIDFYKSGNEGQFNEILKFYLLDHEMRNHQNTLLLKEFFVRTDTLQRACDYIISIAGNGVTDRTIILLFEETLDDSLFEHYVDEYVGGELRGNEFIKKVIIRGRYYIKKNPYLSDKLIESGNQELIINELDYDEDFRKKQKQNYFDSLFDDESLKELIYELVEISGNENLKFGQLLEVDYEKTQKRRDLVSLKIQLYHFFRTESEEVITHYIEKKTLEWYRITQIYKELNRETIEIEVSDEQTDYILSYYKKNIEKENFKQMTNKGIVLIFFMIKFEFFCKKEILLDMLMVPIQYFGFYNNNKELQTEKINFNEKPFGYLEDKIEDDLVRNRVIKNIDEEILTGEVLRAHLMYCKKYKLENAIDLATKVCINDEESNYYKCEAVQYLIVINKLEYILSELLPNVSEELKLDIARLVSKIATPEMVSYFEEYYKSDTTNWRLVEYLIEMNSRIGLDAYFDMIKDSGLEKSHDNSISKKDDLTRTIECISDIKHLNWVMKLIKLEFNGQFQDNGIYRLYNSIYNILSHMCYADKENDKKFSLSNYLVVAKALKDIKEKNEENFELLGFCNNWLIDHENIARNFKQKTYTIAEVKKIIDSIS